MPDPEMHEEKISLDDPRWRGRFTKWRQGPPLPGVRHGVDCPMSPLFSDGRDHLRSMCTCGLRAAIDQLVSDRREGLL
jgi:hypothetical protein